MKKEEIIELKKSGMKRYKQQKSLGKALKKAKKEHLGLKHNPY